jgi:hypothetical protein
VRRNQGWLWRAAVAIWATQLYYRRIADANADPESIRLEALPADVLQMINGLLDTLSDPESLARFGLPRDEVIATFNHHYAVLAKKGRAREWDVFCHLISKGGIPEEDKTLLRSLILAVEDYALILAPDPLSGLIDELEGCLGSQGALETPVTSEERAYLQLHCLVALHDLLVDIDPKAFKDLVGLEMGSVQPMLFVSCYEDNVSLDLGFFALDDGKHVEPVTLRVPSYGWLDGKIETFYYPCLMSDLPVSESVVEADDNIRLCLYNHPLAGGSLSGPPCDHGGGTHFSSLPTDSLPIPTALEMNACLSSFPMFGNAAGGKTPFRRTNRVSYATRRSEIASAIRTPSSHHSETATSTCSPAHRHPRRGAFRNHLSRFDFRPRFLTLGDCAKLARPLF